MAYDGVERRKMDMSDRDRLTRVEEGLRAHRESSETWRDEMRRSLKNIGEKVEGIPTDPPRHKEDHDFITAFIEREKRRTERAEKIKAQVGGWLIVSALSGVGYAVWHWVRALFRAP